jgi:hypothetical protein
MAQNGTARALVAGWFSYPDGHATAGDLLASDVLCEWLTDLRIDHVVATAPPFTDGPSLSSLSPDDFTHAFFVCGPWQRSNLEADFVSRFAGCRLIGIDVSLDDPPGDWRPFDLLIERDSIDRTNPDLVFASRNPLPPVIGVCLVEAHPGADTERAHEAVQRLLAKRELACIPIDTRLDSNGTKLRTKGEVEAVIGRMDALVTTRLHGVVLSLKNGVPALAIDAVRGSGKIKRQCTRIGWPYVLTLDELTDEALDRMLADALSRDARDLARGCAERAISDLDAVRGELSAGLGEGGTVERNFLARRSDPVRSIEPPREGAIGMLRRLIGRDR